MKKICKNCEHWKNQQRLLNYSDLTGTCTNKKLNFNIHDGRLLGVIDTENLRDMTKITGNPSNDTESIELSKTNFSRYIIATDELFGCNKFEQKKETK